MKFKYQAKNKQGKKRGGNVEASSKEAAIDVLKDKGLYVVSLEKIGGGFSFEELQAKLFGGISKKDLAAFSRQLSVMLKSEVSFAQSLRSLAVQSPNPNFKKRVLNIAESVEQGVSLSEALAVYPETFSPFYVSLIKSGEASGKIVDSLNYLSDHLEREYNINSQIKGAMIYPAVVLTVVIGAIIIIVVGVIPPFADLLKETDQELPMMTKIMLWSYNFLKSYWWTLIILVGGLVGLVFYYFKTKAGKRFFDKVSVKLPWILGSFFQKIYLNRFAENLSTLLSAGLPITQALRITRGIIGNVVYEDLLEEAEDTVSRGKQINTVLANNSEIVPAFVTQMTRVGENTGRLSQTLMEIVKYYQSEIERNIDTFMNLLEPLIIIFLGGIVGVIVLSVFMPLYGMMGSF